MNNGQKMLSQVSLALIPLLLASVGCSEKPTDAEIRSAMIGHWVVSHQGQVNYVTASYNFSRDGTVEVAISQQPPAKPEA